MTFDTLNICLVTIIHSLSSIVYRLSEVATARTLSFIIACDRELWKALEDEDRCHRVDAVIIKIVLGRLLALFSN